MFQPTFVVRRMAVALAALVLAFGLLAAIAAPLPARADGDTTSTSQTVGNVTVITTINNKTGAVTVEIFGKNGRVRTDDKQDGRMGTQTTSTTTGDQDTTVMDEGGNVETTSKP
jgi:hypothetical protein